MLSFIQPDWIVFAGGVTFILGYLIINQVILRLLVTLGTVFYIWYYIVALEDPTAAVMTSVMMGTANFIGLAQLWYQQSNLAIPEEHRDIYTNFGTVPPGDFRNIMKVAKRYTTAEDRILTTEGTPVEKLYFILSGELIAKKKGFDFPLPNGIFVGEVAYLVGQASSATTFLKNGAEVIEWDVSTLYLKSKKNVRFKLALEALISNDLARKVTVSVTRTTEGPR